MANDNFYGYKRNPKKVNTKVGARGSVDLDFESNILVLLIIFGNKDAK